MDISAADINEADLVDSASTPDVAEALSSLPSHGVSGLSNDDNKFQTAIAAWRSICSPCIKVDETHAT